MPDLPSLMLDPAFVPTNPMHLAAVQTTRDVRDVGTASLVGSDAGATGSPLAAEPVVRVSRLVKRFAARRTWTSLLRVSRFRREWATAVHRVSFDVWRGELFGLLGPNGAGKTTLLKMLSTLIEPDEGTAVIGGADLRRNAAAVRRMLVPVVADERSLNWRLNARENLRFYGALHGLVGEALHARIATVLEVVGLEAAGSKLVGAFSSGMRQRLLVARALLARPAVLLLDEPTRSMDPIAARDFRAFLRTDIAGAQKCTILLATHDAEEGLALCDRVAVLDRGRLVACGSPRELMRLADRGKYRVRTPDPCHPMLARLSAVTAVRDQSGGDPVWTTVQLQIPGGDSDAQRTLHRLVDEGVEVSRFEKVEPSLAELIEWFSTNGRSQG